jgi:hypothetical protein
MNPPIRNKALPHPDEQKSTQPDLILERGSVALTRLIEEVKYGKEIRIEGYNRTYHRHNR